VYRLDAGRKRSFRQDCGDAAMRRMLLALARVDRNGFVGQAGFLGEQRHLHRVGRKGAAELQHASDSRVERVTRRRTRRARPIPLR